MIRINKMAEPQILSTYKAAWTRELLSYHQAGQQVPAGIGNRYNHDEIKSALRLECRNKCMYCESNVSHVSYEHIEHIKPKAKDKFPQLTFEWVNLGLACPVCNINKSDTYDALAPYINPYEEDPGNFILALGHFIYHQGGNSRGEITKRDLELNRPDLIEKRKERLESINRLIDRYHAEQNQRLKESIKAEIEIEIADDKPYSMCAKSLYQALMN